MEIKASLNHLHIAPRKARLVASSVRGLDADRALAVLGAMRRRASGPVAKLLRSALADGAHNFQAGAASFYIKEIRVDSGPVTKRFRARAFGRAAPIRKRTSHISLVLDARDARAAAAFDAAKKTKIVAREAVLPGVGRGSPWKPGGRKPAAADMQKPKKSGAIRKIFQRKVI